MKKTINTVAWCVLAFLAIAVGLYAFSYLSFNPELGILRQKAAFLKSSLAWKLAFYSHVVGGGVGLIAGVFQFRESIRKKVPVHRALGKVYLGAIALGGLSGFVVAVFTEGGFIAQSGFVMLAVGWLFTTWMAYKKIRARQIDEHRNWMLRSYALCCAAITLRIILPFEQAVLHMDFVPAYRFVAWACWVPNLVVIEWYIKSRNATIAAV